MKAQSDRRWRTNTVGRQHRRGGGCATADQVPVCLNVDFSCTTLYTVGRDSSVGTATGYGLDGPGIESQWRRYFPHLSRPAMGPSQPPVQWVPGLSLGVKSGRGVTLTPHLLLVPWSRKSRAIPLLPLCAVGPVQSLSACTRVHFTFFFTLYTRKLTMRVHSLQTCAGPSVK